MPTNLPPGGIAPPGLIQTAAKRVWLSLNHVPPPPYQIPMSTRDTTTATHQQPQPQRDNSGSSGALTQRQKKRLRYKRNKQQKRGLPVEAPPRQSIPTLPTPALPGPTLTHVAPLPATESPAPLPVSHREDASPVRHIRRPDSGMLRSPISQGDMHSKALSPKFGDNYGDNYNYRYASIGLEIIRDVM